MLFHRRGFCCSARLFVTLSRSPCIWDREKYIDGLRVSPGKAKWLLTDYLIDCFEGHARCVGGHIRTRLEYSLHRTTPYRYDREDC